MTTFIEHLSGVDLQSVEVVKIRDRYDASVPTVVGAVERQKLFLWKMLNARS